MNDVYITLTFVDQLKMALAIGIAAAIFSILVIMIILNLKSHYLRRYKALVKDWRNYKRLYNAQCQSTRDEYCQRKRVENELSNARKIIATQRDMFVQINILKTVPSITIVAPISTDNQNETH